jgi:MoaA/NifB/PqqE/SkfB family radical SAM enzyme
MHCHIWQNPVQEGEELSTEKCIEVIRELAGLDVLNISFSGGEPLLRKDIFDLISHATERGISAGLDTNGVLVSRERAVELARAGIKSIYVSLDSIVPKTHDKIRGVQGTFDKVMEGLENLAGIRKQGKTALFLNTTISRENAFELPSIMKLAKAKGVDGVTFSLLQDVEKYSPESELILKKDNILYLEQQLSILFEEYGDLLPHSKKYFSYFSEFIQNPGIAYNFRCLALFGVIQIAPVGGIFPCPVAFEKIGNLKNHSVREIWKSKQANITRK